MTEKIEKKERKLEKRIIIILVLLLILVIITFGYLLLKKDNRTAILDSSNKELQKVEETSKLRVIMNSSVQVSNDTMQNLNFENVNEGRLLKCKIKPEGSSKYIYESQYVKAGEIITADLLDGKIEKGTTNCIAEIYSYDTKTKEKIGQVNVKITLVRI